MRQNPHQRSEENLTARRASVPALNYPEALPITAARQDILAALRGNQVVVVEAETGSGKSTQLPKMLLEIGCGVAGEIVHTQPRRIATRATATRLAEELGVPLGTLVGYQIRFEQRADAGTLVRVATDGIILAQLAHDPLLMRYDAIIVDEAHERSLNIDFLLGALRRIVAARKEFKVILTSATFEADRFSEAFGGCPVIRVPGRAFPVEVRWLDIPAEDHADPILMADAIEACLVEGPGDVLAFLPGEREILEVAHTLRGRAGARDVEILPLYGRLGDAQQDEVFALAKTRRVTLATNVAESSLTVPGVRFVVDSGLVRMSRFSPKSRIERLLVEPASQASLEQRRGRAGRVAAGVCVRLGSAEDFQARSVATPPEIKRTSLAGVILRMRDLGLGEPSTFPFLDPPGARQIEEGERTLVEIGATDRHGRLSGVGKKMAKMPVDPRVARVVVAGLELNCAAAALTIAAFLSVADPRDRPADQAQLADLSHQKFADLDGDYMSALKLWTAWKEARDTLGSSALRRWCKEHFLSQRRLREWSDVRRQLEWFVRDRLHAEVGSDAATPPARAVHEAVLAGFATQVAHRGVDGQYKLSDGQTFAIHPRSSLARRNCEWIVVGEVVDTGRRLGRLAGKVQPTWIEKMASHLVKRSTSEPHYIRDTGQVAAWERVSFGELDLIPRRRVPYGVDNQVEARVIFIRSALVEEQLGVQADFVTHNRMIEEQVNSIARARRQANLLANADRKFQFYDSVVPPTIFNRASFEKWRAVIERRKPEILRMSQSDFFVEPLADSHEAKWPLQLDVGSHVVNVLYQHEPGADADGVTVRVPLLELPDLDCDRLEWLVPGLIAEKIEALIRSLPKRVRARFQPVEAVIQAFLEQYQVGSGSLLELLARELKRASGLEVRVEDFALANVPAHFSARVEVIESDGRVLATGRDARGLVKKFAAQSDLARREVIARTTNGLPIGKEFAWWIAPLPAVLPMLVNIGHQAGQVRAWAALEMCDGQEYFKSRSNVRHPDAHVKAGATSGLYAIDQEVHNDRGVRLRQFATFQEAHESQSRALCELVLQLNRGAIEHHLDFYGEFMAIQSVAGSSSDAWKHQLVARIAQLILLEGKEALPTRDEFNQQIEGVDKKILGASQCVLYAVAALANEVRALDSDLKRPAPASWAPILQDAQSERDDLLRPDWLQDMPLNYLLVASTLIKAHRARVAQLEGAGVLRAQRDQFDALWKPRLAQERPRRCEASTWSQLKWSVRFARLLPWGAGHGLTPPIRERDLEALWLGVTR